MQEQLCDHGVRLHQNIIGKGNRLVCVYCSEEMMPEADQNNCDLTTYIDPVRPPV